MNYRDFFKEDILRGGKGDKKSPKNVDPKELAMGIKVEMEHTKDSKLAREIAMDHLTEDPHYYSKLKKAGLADELKEDMACGCGDDKDLGQGDKMAQAAGLASMNPQEDPNSSIVEPDTKSVDRQTVHGTVFPPVDKDPSTGANMSGCIGNTKGIAATDKTNVDAPPKDPQPTDHITGGMGSTPANPSILPKQSGQLGGGAPMMQQMMQTLMPKDISIDIAEGKKLLKKMMMENTKGPARAFGPTESCVPAGGNPDTDPAFKKGKRWTISTDRPTPKMKESMDQYGAMGELHQELAQRAIQWVVDASSGDYESDIGSVYAYLEDQGIKVPVDYIEKVYKVLMTKKNGAM